MEILKRNATKPAVKKAATKPVAKSNNMVTMTRADGLTADVHPNNVTAFKDAGYK